MRRESPYTLAHRVLLDAQRRNGATLQVNQVQERLQSTPGLVFTPGTTVETVLRNLERWELVTIKGQYVTVFPE